MVTKFLNLAGTTIVQLKSEKTKRHLWVDNLRGFVMLAVVIGHIATPLTNFIFSWHMITFFFISGFFINENMQLKQLFTKEIKRLMIPFLIFSLFALVIEIAKRYFFSSSEFSVKQFNIISELKGIFVWMDYSHLHTYGFVLWFLPALFWGKSIVAFCLKYLKNKYLIFGILLPLYFIMVNRSFVLPFALDKSILVSITIFAGYYYFKLVSDKKIRDSFSVTPTILLALILLTLPVQYTNLALKIVNNPIEGLAYGFAMALLLAQIFKLFGDRFLNNSFFENWGKNSLFILIIHPYTNNISYIISQKVFPDIWSIKVIISIVMISIVILIYDYTRKKVKNGSFAHCFQPAEIN